MAEIRLSGINKVYPGGTHAVHDVDLHIADGEFMIMVGPSGCAKSTILRMIAGLETPTSGTVEIGGRVVNEVAPKDRDIAMVFQSYALYPHMTVRENMAFGLKLRRMPQGEIEQRVADAARILGLEQLLDRLPKAMSGGQRQRVAMGRAIVREPQAFLMDEPLSNLDAKLRVQMRTEIAKLHQRLSTTTVYVTHDQVEAMTLGQRICILRTGVIQQVDTPFQVYQNPANVFVGGFIGSPGMNFMDGQLMQHGQELHLQLGDRVLALPPSVTQRLTTGDVHGRRVIVGIRPEHLSPTTDEDPSGIPVHVELTEAMGAEVYAYFTAAVSSPDLTALADTQASMSSFVARLPAGTETRGGEPMQLRPDLHEVHLFDPVSMSTLLAPAEEAAVRARQSGVAIEAVGGTSRSFTTPADQPLLSIEPAMVGTLGDADPSRIRSVFDQPVASPIQLEPLTFGAAPPPTSSYPRPTFADQITDGSTLDQFSMPETAPATALAPAPTRRGFAPRVVGARIGEPGDERQPASAPAVSETIDLHTDSLDAALARIEQVEQVEQVEQIDDHEHAPAIPFATLRRDAAAPAPGVDFRAALARIRQQDAAPNAAQDSRPPFKPAQF